jgi:hypothetical protein
MGELTRHEHARHGLRLTLSRERWDRSKGLQQAITVAFVLSSLGAVGNWYNWLRGAGSLCFPAVLTVIAMVSLALTPRKWQLLVMSAGGMLGLEILAVVLHKGPEGPMFEAMAVTAAVTGAFQYVRAKVERPRGEAGAQGPTDASGRR